MRVESLGSRKYLDDEEHHWVLGVKLGGIVSLQDPSLLRCADHGDCCQICRDGWERFGRLKEG